MTVGGPGRLLTAVAAAAAAAVLLGGCTADPPAGAPETSAPGSQGGGLRPGEFRSVGDPCAMVRESTRRRLVPVVPASSEGGTLPEPSPSASRPPTRCVWSGRDARTHARSLTVELALFGPDPVTGGPASERAATELHRSSRFSGIDRATRLPGPGDEAYVRREDSAPAEDSRHVIVTVRQRNVVIQVEYVAGGALSNVRRDGPLPDLDAMQRGAVQVAGEVVQAL